MEQGYRTALLSRGYGPPHERIPRSLPTRQRPPHGRRTLDAQTGTARSDGRRLRKPGARHPATHAPLPSPGHRSGRCLPTPAGKGFVLLPAHVFRPAFHFGPSPAGGQPARKPPRCPASGLRDRYQGSPAVCRQLGKGLRCPGKTATRDRPVHRRPGSVLTLPLCRPGKKPAARTYCFGRVEELQHPAYHRSSQSHSLAFPPGFDRGYLPTSPVPRPPCIPASGRGKNQK